MLLVITIVLALLLRSIVAPLLLVATVVLSVGATVGVAALLFENVFGFPGSDPGILLIGFVFLVALGIDYNIFLMTRAREESARPRHEGRRPARAGGHRRGDHQRRAGAGGDVRRARGAAAGAAQRSWRSWSASASCSTPSSSGRCWCRPPSHLIGDKVWWPSKLAQRRAEPERELEPV